MADAFSVLKTRCFLALRDTPVATAAGVASGTWSSTSYPRVFFEDSGFIGHRNRGRLPFVEFWIETQDYNKQWDIGGTISTAIVVRVHLGGSNVDTVADESADILTACALSLRTYGSDNLMDQGTVDAVTALQKGPWGHIRDMRISVNLTFDRADYERA